MAKQSLLDRLRDRTFHMGPDSHTRQEAAKRIEELEAEVNACNEIANAWEKQARQFVEDTKAFIQTEYSTYAPEEIRKELSQFPADKPLLSLYETTCQIEGEAVDA